MIVQVITADIWTRQIMACQRTIQRLGVVVEMPQIAARCKIMKASAQEPLW